MTDEFYQLVVDNSLQVNDMSRVDYVIAQINSLTEEEKQVVDCALTRPGRFLGITGEARKMIDRLNQLYLDSPLRESSVDDVVLRDTEKNIDTSHYRKTKIEPIKVIQDWRLSYELGCAVKYIARHPYKDEPIKDLRKAMDYIQIEIDKQEKENG